MFDQSPVSNAVRHGFYLREWRKHRRMTLAQLAAPLGHDPSVIARYEKGEHDPKIETIIRLARALGIAPGDLFRHPDEPSLDYLLAEAPNEAKPHIVNTLRAMVESFRTKIGVSDQKRS